MAAADHQPIHPLGRQPAPRRRWPWRPRCGRLLDGRYNVSFEDVRRVYLPALRHRVIFNFEAQAEGIEPDKVLLDLLETVPEKEEKYEAEGKRDAGDLGMAPRYRVAPTSASMATITVNHKRNSHGRDLDTPEPATAGEAGEDGAGQPEDIPRADERRAPQPAKGQSVEFADFRNYVAGDDLRFVDWNTYARLDRLFLKMFLEEEDLHFYTLIDASGSMDFGTPTKLAYAVQLAAALGFVGLVRGDRVKIETLGQPAPGPAPVFRGRRSLWRMLDHLEGIQAAANHLAGRRRQELLHPQLRPRHRRAAERPDGQGRLRDRPCATWSRATWTST